MRTLAPVSEGGGCKLFAGKRTESRLVALVKGIRGLAGGDGGGGQFDPMSGETWAFFLLPSRLPPPHATNTHMPTRGLTQ